MKNVRHFRWWRLFLVPLCLCAAVPLCLLAAVPAAQAQVASVDTGRTTPDTPIQLTVTLPSGDGEVDTSAIQDFRVLSRGSSSSVQIVNGQVISEQTQTFSLLPLREGSLTIPALKVTVKGKTSYTDPIVIQVESGAEGADTTGPENVQVTGSVDDPSPYLGQQIIYTFELLYAVQIANTSYEAPSFEGFSATQIGEQKTGQQVIDGRRYNKVAISYLLVPLRTGPLTIQPAQLQCDVVVSTRRNSRSQFDFFNDSFFGGSQLATKYYRSEPVAVTVLPLPAWTGSEPFSGLVGRFEMAAALEKETATVGASVTLSVTLRGEGNLQDAAAPGLGIPDTFKQYRDQPETDVSLDENGYSGTKVFRTALVPIQAGDYAVSVTPSVYFDPDQEAYRPLAPAPLSLAVEASASPAEPPTVFSARDAGGSASEAQKRKVDFTGRDILSIKTDRDAVKNRAALATGWFLALLLAPGVLFISSLCLLRAVKKDPGPAAEMARKSRLALKTAAALRDPGDPELLSGLYRALLYAVMSRAGVTGESLTAAEVDALLAGSSVPPATAGAVSTLFGRLESARFGKSPLTGGQEKSLVAETRKLMNDLIR